VRGVLSASRTDEETVIMADELEKTSPVVTMPSVLAVHCSADLLRRCVDAAALAGMTARECDLRSMGRQAAQRRPTAIVVPSYLHEFDPTEFDALAREVGAALLIVDEEIGQTELDDLIVGVGLRRPRSPRAAQGRYSVVGGCATEVTRAAPPSNTCVRLLVGDYLRDSAAPRRSRVA
jgi:hypothetical protein